MTLKHALPVVRIFALICVAVTSAYVMWQGWRLVDLLAAPTWCSRAINASNKGDQPEFAVSGCFSLLKDQVAALAIGMHIYAGVIAFCLAALMVIVVANGRASGKGPGGFELDIGGNREPETPAEGAAAAAGAAQDVAAGLAEGEAK